MDTDRAAFLSREAEDAEAVAEAEERGERPPMPGQRARRSASDPAQVYSVRIPVSQLEALRIAALKVGKAPSTLMREWVLERLVATQSPADEQGTSVGPAAVVRARDRINLGPRRRTGETHAAVRSRSGRAVQRG